MPMSLSDPEDQLRSYIFVLTLWRDRDDAPWRAALRPADGGARLGFGDLEQLMVFLLRLDDCSATPSGAGVEGLGTQRVPGCALPKTPPFTQEPT